MDANTWDMTRRRLVVSVRLNVVLASQVRNEVRVWREVRLARMRRIVVRLRAMVLVVADHVWKRAARDLRKVLRNVRERRRRDLVEFRWMVARRRKAVKAAWTFARDRATSAVFSSISRLLCRVAMACH